MSAGSKNHKPRPLGPKTKRAPRVQRDARETKATCRSRPHQQFSLLRCLASHQEEVAP